MEKEKSNIKIHFFYVSVFLVSIIILLLTKNFGDDKNIIEYFTFGMTVTSIALAILAIVYSFVSNTSFNQIIGSLKDSSQTIMNNSNNLKNVSDNIQSNSITLNNASSDLKEKIDSISELLEPIEKKTTEMHKEVLNISSMFQANKTTIGKSESLVEFKDDYLEDFLYSSSFMGHLSIFISKFSFSNNMEVNLDSLANSNPLLSKAYLLSYIVAMNSAKIIITDNSSKGDFIKVTKLNKYLTDNVEKVLEISSKPEFDVPNIAENITRANVLKDVKNFLNNLKQ